MIGIILTVLPIKGTCWYLKLVPYSSNSILCKNTFDQLIILFHEVSEEGKGSTMELIEGTKEKQKKKERDACKCFCFAKKLLIMMLKSIYFEMISLVINLITMIHKNKIDCHVHDSNTFTHIQ